MLARLLKMPITIDVGYHNTAREAPCSPLAGASANVDYRGQLTLCCNLSGFRGALGAADVVGDLASEPFADAQQRLHRLAVDQADRRLAALASLERAGEEAGLADRLAVPVLPGHARQDAVDDRGNEGNIVMSVNTVHTATATAPVPHDHVVFTDLDGTKACWST